MYFGFPVSSFQRPARLLASSQAALKSLIRFPLRNLQSNAKLRL